MLSLFRRCHYTVGPASRSAKTDVRNIHLAAIIAKQQDDLSMPLTNSCAINLCRMEFINLLSCGIVDTWHPSTSSSIDRLDR